MAVAGRTRGVVADQSIGHTTAIVAQKGSRAAVSTSEFRCHPTQSILVILAEIRMAGVEVPYVRFFQAGDGLVACSVLHC